MTDPWQELHQIFLNDHREMTRGFRQLLLAIRDGKDREAARLADHLDILSGPHIAFEERHLYPRVRQQRGKEYADRLYHEHREMLDSLRTLQALAADSPSARLSDSDRQAVAGQLETGLQHAATCGTLLSHLQSLPGNEQLELLDTMRAIRQRPCRWTELATSERATG